MTASSALESQSSLLFKTAEMLSAIHNELKGGAEQGGVEFRNSEVGVTAACLLSYNERFTLRHNVLAMFDCKCPPEVELMLHIAFQETFICNKETRLMCGKCHTMKELVNLGVARFNKPWTVPHMKKKYRLEARGKSEGDVILKRRRLVISGSRNSVRPDRRFRKQSGSQLTSSGLSIFPTHAT